MRKIVDFSITIGLLLLLVGLIGVFLSWRQARERDARSAAVDTLVLNFRDTVFTTLKPDTVRETQILRLPGARARTDSVIIRDTVLLEVVRAERALSDSICAKCDSALLLRSRLLERSTTVIDSVLQDRNRFRAASRRKGGFGCALGPTVVADGLRPLGITCGLTLSLRFF